MPGAADLTSPSIPTDIRLLRTFLHDASRSTRRVPLLVHHLHHPRHSHTPQHHHSALPLHFSSEVDRLDQLHHPTCTSYESASFVEINVRGDGGGEAGSPAAQPLSTDCQGFMGSSGEVCDLDRITATKAAVVDQTEDEAECCDYRACVAGWIRPGCSCALVLGRSVAFPNIPVLWLISFFSAGWDVLVVSNQAAWVAAAQMPLIIALAGKNNLVSCKHPI